MRYINKEYGFTFRPPFYQKFYAEDDKGPKITDANYPMKYIQGVGYDYSAINGAMLIGRHGTAWGIKISYYNGKKWLDGNDFIESDLQEGANTADGSFAHFVCGDLSIKWAKLTECGMALKISSAKKLKVRVISYPCFGYDGELSIENCEVKGRSPYAAILKGSVSIGEHNAVFKDRYLVIDEEHREYFLLKSFNKPSDFANGAFNESIMEFVMGKNQPEIYMYAYIGDKSVYEKNFTQERIANQLQTAELRYGVNRFNGSGVLGSGAERMYNSVLWSRMYYPYFMDVIFSPRRSEIDNHFDIRGLDENCGAIWGCLVEPEKSVSQAYYTVEDKIMGALTVWYSLVNAGTVDNHREILDKLIAVNPTNSNLIVSDNNKSEIAYKWSDSPLKEQYKTTSMYSLDLSCLKLLDFDIIIRFAKKVGATEIVEQYEKVYEELKAKINETLFCRPLGMYMNRYVTGEWATSVGATSFYPLICGAVEEDNLSGVIKSLTDPELFWGDFVVPTLSRNHKEFGKKSKPDNNGKRSLPFLKYRGSIIPYVNFIIYYGLVRYGESKIAGEVAKKSATLWFQNESVGVLNYERYLPTGRAQKTSPSSAGNMLEYIAVKELIDLEYFDGDEGLRFGTLVDGENTLNNISILGHVYSISVDDSRTVLIMDGQNIFRGDGGKFKVRHFRLTDNGGSFDIETSNNITVNLNVVHPETKKMTRYYFIAKPGKNHIEAKDGLVNIDKI